MNVGLRAVDSSRRTSPYWLVVRIAVENAVSVAGVLLLSEATLTEKRQEKPASADLPAD